MMRGHFALCNNGNKAWGHAYRAEQVHVYDGREVIRCRFFDFRATTADASIVDQYVEPAELPSDPLCRGVDLCLVGHVELSEPNIDPCIGQFTRGPAATFSISRADVDDHPFGCQ